MTFLFPWHMSVNVNTHDVFYAVVTIVIRLKIQGKVWLWKHVIQLGVMTYNEHFITQKGLCTWSWFKSIASMYLFSTYKEKQMLIQGWSNDMPPFARSHRGNLHRVNSSPTKKKIRFLDCGALKFHYSALLLFSFSPPYHVHRSLEQITASHAIAFRIVSYFYQLHCQSSKHTCGYGRLELSK